MSSPRGKRNHGGGGGGGDNGQALYQDFARLEEAFNQKLNSLNENVATLASYSVQNTLDENFISDAAGLKATRPSMNINASGQKKRETMSKSSKREASSFTKITSVADTVRAAMAQAVFKRQQAQRHLANLEGEVLGQVKENPKEETPPLTVETGVREDSEDFNEERDSQHEQKQVTTSPSTRMMEMMRNCFQQELAPLKTQLDDLSARVGQLEEKKEKDVPRNRNIIHDDVEILVDRGNSTALAPTGGDTPRKGSLKKNTTSGIAATSAAHVHFKESELSPVKKPFEEGKKGSGVGKQKGGLKDEISRLANVEKEKGYLTKHDKKKLEATSKLAHAYLDGSSTLPRVKTAPSSRPQSLPHPTTVKTTAPSPAAAAVIAAYRPRTSSPSPSSKRDGGKVRKIQEAFDDLAKIKSVGLDESAGEMTRPPTSEEEVKTSKNDKDSSSELLHSDGNVKEDEVIQVEVASPQDDQDVKNKP
mmetsp:Transcript_10136/g.18939  ORF Transcript_10136/g.18939 Transcript_10136/m.18939 type:complete len:477 (+) Transcript_10136:2-1432(+)